MIICLHLHVISFLNLFREEAPLEITTVFYHIWIQKYEVFWEKCWNFTAGGLVTGSLIHSFTHFHSLTGHTHTSKWYYSCARYISLIPLNVIFLPLHTVLCALKDWVQCATRQISFDTQLLVGDIFCCYTAHRHLQTFKSPIPSRWR